MATTKHQTAAQCDWPKPSAHRDHRDLRYALQRLLFDGFAPQAMMTHVARLLRDLPGGCLALLDPPRSRLLVMTSALAIRLLARFQAMDWRC
mmetsp:Transcript_43650/g.120746  ORF Transcript_43650/g.120746 Transcript_43650/m.120746 type:complete len:92 (-) Transcript_43650:753-1028(-)